MVWPNIVDFLPIDPEYSFVEIAVPDVWVGKTLLELDLRRKHALWDSVGVKDAMTEHLEMFPGGDYQIGVDQLLLVIGKQDKLAAIRDL